jgi:hypothetical protein
MMLRYLAARRFNIIDGTALCAFSVAVHLRDYWLAGGILVVGLLVSATVEALADR